MVEEHPGTHTQDVFSATVQHEAVGSGSSNGLRFAIAGLLGRVTS